MPMTKAGMASDIKAKVTALLATPAWEAANAEDKADMMWEAISDGIITHITSNAQLTFRPSDSGAQVSTAPGSPTTGPVPAIMFLPGQIS